ncbi:hypothetical protein OV208_37620 [Corallococcus sp. bb12-1]|uniref:hypothetical protein n=1 Tax=Corallococcus sp. bb12-1 TaxID=2996784 RepID=UPI002271C864|nr:hypothetical protein [Corallococcus sp. bb12-1]MCY1047082.1 hypothetical protein [Corallococcus sp. bb12-1]
MHKSLKFAGTLMLALGLTACPGNEDPDEPLEPVLRISPSPAAISDDGQTSTLSITATDKDGNPGTGSFYLDAAAGLVDTESATGGSKAQTFTLVDGKASTTFRCEKALDVGCTGDVTITGTWAGINKTTRVTVRPASTQTDAGTDGGTKVDAGTDAGTKPDGGTTDAGTDGGIVVSDPAEVTFVSSTKDKLNILSSNVDTSTLVTFKVLNLNRVGVANVAVDFTVTGAAGTTLEPISGTTDSTGQVSTTLQSGNEVGFASVQATVTVKGTKLSGKAKDISIIGLRASDEHLAVQCTQINLAANASETPPRTDLNTACSVQLTDRFNKPVTVNPQASFFAEVGTVDKSTPPTSQAPGLVTTKFYTAGRWPPQQVSPLEGEPDHGGNNPRDMLVTIIAVTPGEEAFYDGSGASNGVKNGKWDPGEWFVDLPEPFVDSNDNGQWDSGESFIDTERLDCTTGQRAEPNKVWDGPNGCWDGDTQLWRATHVVYSGFSSVVGTPIVTFFPDPGAAGFDIPKQGEQTFSVRVSDPFGNQLSPDTATITAGVTTSKGTVTVTERDSSLNARTYGMTITHERREVEPAAGQPGYKDVGPCDINKPVSEAVASKARCQWRYTINGFRDGNDATLRLNGATGTTPASVGKVNVVFSNTRNSPLTVSRPLTVQ